MKKSFLLLLLSLGLSACGAHAQKGPIRGRVKVVNNDRVTCFIFENGSPYERPCNEFRYGEFTMLDIVSDSKRDYTLRENTIMALLLRENSSILDEN